MSLEPGEIRRRLSVFAAKWSVYDGSERAEAQTFLNELFDCYGTDRQKVARFEAPQQGRFLDLIWPENCIVEMKAPKEAGKLEKHRRQARDYWENSADVDAGVTAPDYLVICAFRRMEIWQPGKFPNAPVLTLDLTELPDRQDALAFLGGHEPVFTGGLAELTKDAVDPLVKLYDGLRERKAAASLDLREFILQCVWCMFAEDLNLLVRPVFSTIVGELIESGGKRSSADDLGQLFTHLNTPGKQRPDAGMYAGTPYANGGLFAEPARVHLDVAELELLGESTKFDWGQVQPSIFGSLLEGGLGHDNQWKFGAHFTHEADIQKIVQPTIVRPWNERIDAIKTHKEAVAAQNALMNFVVLDPACGSGNFLYVAYRELKRIETRLRNVEHELRTHAGIKPGQEAMTFYPLSNIKGIEIEPFAVALARVTMWMGHKLAVDELDLHEPTLPLADLDGIQRADALELDWPRADAIIGNPPFHGSQNIRGEFGDDYVDWLKKEFGIGVKDYCVYWFRKAHDVLEPDARAGLVGTNSVSQNRARSESLEYIVENGGVITDAVSTQPWPGAAAVHVSIVNWIKQPAVAPDRFWLDGDEVEGITTSLGSGNEGESAQSLPQNKGRCFQGPIPVGDGFVLTPAEAEDILANDRELYGQVVRPYVIGKDIADDVEQRPTRYVVDFALRPLESAEAFPLAIEILRERVKPTRALNSMKRRRMYWWQFGSPASDMRDAIGDLQRFIVGTATGKRILFAWMGPNVCPSNLTNVFAFEDDYAMGILTSKIHTEWARMQSSTLKGDIRYTPTTAFATFPWPTATTAHHDAIAAVARDLYALRGDLCIKHDIGLTKLYNRVDEGAFEELRELHKQLDEAVAAAYGWPKSIAQDSSETNKRLLELNHQIDSGEIEYRPFDYLDAEE